MSPPKINDTNLEILRELARSPQLDTLVAPQPEPSIADTARPGEKLISDYKKGAVT